jgi:predicted DNA-binding protein (MmcQ/YjbR family)
MTLTAVAAHCDGKPRSVRTRPFGPEPLVFKVGGRIFALLGRNDGAEAVSLKCDPERSPVLRASYRSIIPGYHLNKEHWNTVRLDGSVPAALVTELIDHSYDLVAAVTRRARTRRTRTPPRARGRPRRR